MRAAKLWILVGVTFLCVLAAYATLKSRRPSAAGVAASAPLFEDLDAKLGEVAQVKIVSPKGELTLRREGQRWLIVQKDSHPAKATQVSEALLGLAQLKVFETKTAKPELYHLLGVQEPSRGGVEAGAVSTRVTLLGASGATLADLIIGKRPEGTGAPGGEAHAYVRRAEQAQSYEVTGKLAFPIEPMEWVDKAVLELDRTRVQKVVVTRRETEKPAVLTVLRDHPNLEFKVEHMPEGRELAYPSSPQEPATALMSVRVEDVAPRASVNFDAPQAQGSLVLAPPAEQTPGGEFVPASSVTTTFDGLVITARVTRKGDAYWAAFDASFDQPPQILEAPQENMVPITRKPADEVKKEVEELNARLAPWAFAVPEYLARQLSASVESLLKPPAETPAVPPAAP